MLQHKPTLDKPSARQLLRETFGIEDIQQLTELPGERDLNFLVDSKQGNFVLKVSNGREDQDTLVAQTGMLRKLEKLNLCPAIQPTVDGREIGSMKIDEQTHWVRLVTFQEGQTLSAMKYKSPKLLRDLGRKVALIDNELQDYDHPALHYEFDWNLAQGLKVIDSHKQLLSGPELNESIELLVGRFQSHTEQHLLNLPQSVVHNDANDGNVIVNPNEESVTSIIDFGDAIYTWTISDLAIAIAYAILDSEQPLVDAAEIVTGYHSIRPLTPTEADSLFGLVCLRLCVSACMAAQQAQIRPDDEYLTVSQAPLRRTLPRLVDIPFLAAAAVFRTACGIPAMDSYEHVVSWLKENSKDFKFAIRTQHETPEFELVDWSVESDLQDNVLELDIDSADDKINRLLGKNKVGVGRYTEPRLVYASDQFGAGVAERRTIHLGVDLFAAAGTQVVAPLDGEVVVLHEIKISLDYGTLIILKHKTDRDVPFYTLYGHLDWNSTMHLAVGQKVAKGEVIAEFGSREVNGGWSPHLHFQIMLDLLDFENDFPGVAKASEIEAWKQLCPNPNLILNLPDELTTYRQSSTSELLQRRKAKLGGSLSIGYQNPLHVVRGKAQYLFDHTGRRYLDAYNNVPHVGHCHPKVIQAAQQQMKLINTNTRYLHENILQFAESLSNTMPDPLNVCFFLNSASEANELALRMIRCVTNARDLVVLEGAYHGHSSALIDISPYKHDGPGGRGRPDWVHTAPVADTFRGEFRDADSAGKKYADKVEEICDSLKVSGRRLSGFIAESCPSVGGQIIFPSGYLKQVYKTIREHGGLCVADDVQTGYGRLGSAFYGFELQDVVPDIVVLGKPIGNGHPLAALVTTEKIAQEFDNGMEFFSTFGGNNVSCAIGQTVLDIVKQEDLQQKALVTGQTLLDGLAKLKSRFSIIGDVRGSGLFLGVELVRDPETLEPADTEASFISNRMRDLGILLGTDGPLHNVIKIRPPMPFDQQNAQHLLSTLERCFEELECLSQ